MSENRNTFVFVYGLNIKKIRLIHFFHPLSNKKKQNFRVLKFGLKQCKMGVAKNVAEALVKFAFPSNHLLLFSYTYR